jgi:hypothetical protein
MLRDRERGAATGSAGQDQDLWSHDPGGSSPQTSYGPLESQRHTIQKLHYK